MEMNWDSIKYIFQIPLEWYKKVHNRIFKAYGTNFIRVRDGYYDGMEVGIDYDEFAQMVNDSISGTGYVKSVDEIPPDENGNVELSGYVKSVNNTLPDNNGNVSVDIDTQNFLAKGDWANQASLYNVCPYVYSNTAYVNGTLPGGVTNLYTWVGALNYDTLDEEIEDFGYIKGIALSGYVQEDELTDYVQQNDLTNYVQQDELTNYVQQDELTDYVQYDELSDVATKTELSDYATKTELSDYATKNELSDYATQNDLSNYVDLSTNQNVDGEKTWKDTAHFQDDIYVIRPQATGSGCKLYHNSSNQAGLLLNGASGAGSIISMTTGNATATITNATGALAIEAPSMITLNGPKNMVYLSASPDNLALGEAVATVGYVRNQISGVTNNNLTVITGVTWNGTQIQVASQKWNFKNGMLTATTNNANTYIDTVAYSPT